MPDSRRLQSVQTVHGNGLTVTAGGNQAFLNVALGILDPGDEVILPVPSYYFNHEMAITMVNARPVLVPTDSNYQLDLGALRAAITPRTRAIVATLPTTRQAQYIQKRRYGRSTRSARDTELCIILQ